MYTGKKALALSLAAIIMASPLAAGAEKLDIKDDGEIQATIEEVKGNYRSFSGKIKNVSIEDGKGSILVKGEDEDLVFHINEDVLVTDMRKTKENKMMHLKEGAKITAFYGKNTPVALSLPAQLTPEVIVVENEEGLTAKVDNFDKDLISSDNQLKLNVEDAEEYASKKLLVIYGPSTKSIPAQTTPEIIFILDEKVEEPKEEVEDIKVLDKIKIDGREVKMNMYKNSKGVVMVPVRDIAEALDYKLTWNGKTKPIELTKDGQWTKITLGKNSYSFARMANFELEAAPELKNGTTYVPASFIEKVLRVDSFNIIDGMLEIK